MLRIPCLAAGLLMTLVAVPMAQPSCGMNDFELVSDNSTSAGLMGSPSGYEGFIIGGNLAPGSWTLAIDDSGWPSSASARRSHLVSMYVYDADSSTFSLTLPMHQVQLVLTGTNQTFDGVASVTFTAIDSNGNGSLSNSEFNTTQSVSMTVDATCGTTGTAFCGGMGSANGAASPDAQTTPASVAGALQTEACVTAVESSPWSEVKTIYRD